MQTRLILAVIALAAGAGPAAAQLTYPVKIEDAAVGLPAGRFGQEKDAGTQKPIPVTKRGAWAPIYLKLEMQKEISVGALVRVEAADGDGLRTTLTVPLLSSFAGQLPGAKLDPTNFAYIPYARTGEAGGEVTVTLVTNDGKEKQLADSFKVRYQPFREASSYVVLSVGSRLPGFDLPSDNANKNPQSTRGGLRGGRVETAAITSVAELPDMWIGYQAVDMVVMPTGAVPAAFLAELFSETAGASQIARRDALLEWVRRGGKLVISAGSSAGALSQYKAFQALLPRPIGTNPPSRNVSDLALEVTAGNVSIKERLSSRTAPPAPFPVANLAPAAPGRAARTHVPVAAAPGEPDPGPPVVVQTDVGLGRVTFVGFDLDQSPFLDYPSRPAFWDYLLREAGTAKAPASPPTTPVNNYNVDAEDEWLSALRNHVDTFDGVPVVSFGWVALFIALYTLVIGPLEYLFLKYVLGRLELTWITFPLIVASVSAAAYFTAYAIKGNDLKMNKVDVIDVDLGGGRVYGRTWFTVFSPRIDSYTVGVGPRPGVADDIPGGPAPVVGWMGGGSGGGGGGIVSRGYGVHTSPASGGGVTIADGLDRVPIQVWSTKAFTGEWVGAVSPAAPMVKSDLFHAPADPLGLSGSFTANLPFGTVENAVLIYAGVAYKLPALSPGQKVDVGGLAVNTDYFRDAGRTFGTAMTAQQAQQQVFPGRGGQQIAPVASSRIDLAGLLFHEKSTAGRALSNSSLRSLDQSWRVGDTPRAGDTTAPNVNRDVAILVGSVAPPPGLAEPMLTDANGPSATMLWLKGLPSSGQPRPAVPGTLRQETVVRVFIPIAPAGPKQ